MNDATIPVESCTNEATVLGADNSMTLGLEPVVPREPYFAVAADPGSQRKPGAEAVVETSPGGDKVKGLRKPSARKVSLVHRDNSPLGAL
jgi:hypothetical protein